MKKMLLVVAVSLLCVSPSIAEDWQYPPAPQPATLKVSEVQKAVEIRSSKDIATQGAESVFSIFNSDFERVRVRPSGSTSWFLSSSTGEAGKLSISTPGGGVGLGLFPGSGDKARFDIVSFPANWPGVSEGKPTGLFLQGFNKAYYAAYGIQPPEGMPLNDLGISIQQWDNYVGINTIQPKARLEIRDGGLRINNESNLPMPLCNADTRGTFWVSQGEGFDSLYVCLLRKVTNGLADYKWKTIVGWGNKEGEAASEAGF
jgi:hypothetical protein